MTDKQMKTNLEHLRSPQVGDYWQDNDFCKCAICVVTAVGGEFVTVCKTRKTIEPGFWGWDLKILDRMSLAGFANWLTNDHSSEPWVSVWPRAHMWIVKQLAKEDTDLESKAKLDEIMFPEADENILVSKPTPPPSDCAKIRCFGGAFIDTYCKAFRRLHKETSTDSEKITFPEYKTGETTTGPAETYADELNEKWRQRIDRGISEEAEKNSKLRAMMDNIKLNEVGPMADKPSPDKERGRSLADWGIDSTNWKTAPAGSVKLGEYRVLKGYEPLADVLQEALDQAQRGKGAKCHANDKPFLEQPIMVEGRTVGPGFLAGQVRKKVLEAMNCSDDDRAIEDLLGAINYTAALILLRREK